MQTALPALRPSKRKYDRLEQVRPAVAVPHSVRRKPVFLAVDNAGEALPANLKTDQRREGKQLDRN